tara:strand:- start:40 stop:447 length:408 start_codon:yes stop_codon:yes gene_type:complete
MDTVKLKSLQFDVLFLDAKQQAVYMNTKELKVGEEWRHVFDPTRLCIMLDGLALHEKDSIDKVLYMYYGYDKMGREWTYREESKGAVNFLYGKLHEIAEKFVREGCIDIDVWDMRIPYGSDAWDDYNMEDTIRDM